MAVNHKCSQRIPQLVRPALFTKNGEQSIGMDGLIWRLHLLTSSEAQADVDEPVLYVVGARLQVQAGLAAHAHRRHFRHAELCKTQNSLKNNITPFFFQLVLHNWCNNSNGMWYPVHKMLPIKQTLLQTKLYQQVSSRY